MEVIWLAVHEAVGLRKDELSVIVSVNVDAVLAGCIVVTRRVVFAECALVERCAHEEVGHGVNLSRLYIAKTPIYRPHLQTDGNVLRLACCVGAVGIEVLATFRLVQPSAYLAVLVNLAVGILGHRGQRTRQQ